MLKPNSIPAVTVIALILLVALVTAATAGERFRGIVIDIETKEPVETAVVHLVELDRYTTTGENGTFEFDGIERGEYTFVVTHVAYKSKTVTFACTGDHDKHEYIVYLSPKAIEFDPVIVSGSHAHTKMDDFAAMTSVLQGKKLQRELGQTLASTLKNETGVAMRSMGPAPARPVIRGLGGDRVQISEDGTKTTDLSATSPDHAVTLEPFSLERIEVIRGPRVLMQSSTTIGGVVNGIRHEIPVEMQEAVTGSVGAFGESANGGYLGLATLEVPYDPIIVRGEISGKQTGDLRTPGGTLINSDAQNINGALGASFITDGGTLGASMRQFQLDYGVPGGFVGAHPNGVDIEMEKRQYNVQFNHRLHLGEWNLLEAKASRVYYRHKEFETSDAIGAEFKIVDYLASVDVHHNPYGISNGGTLGASADYRDYSVGGFVQNPDNTSTNISFYGYESMHLGNLSIEAGARYQYDAIVPDAPNPDSKIGEIRKRTFNTWSASLSVLYPLWDGLHAGGNISRSSRVPTIEELFTEGPHLAAYSYETGNANLEYERGIGLELFLQYSRNELNLSVTAFRNDLSYYIVPRNTGEINYQTFLPIYATEGVPALFTGMEGSVSYKPLPWLQLAMNASYTHGQNTEDNVPLPQIAPLKSSVSVQYQSGPLAIGAQCELAARQERVDEFEQPTAGYAVYNLFGQYTLVGEGLVHSFALGLDNILDTEYRNHLSRVKSILPEAGRSVRLSYKLFFDFSQ